LENEEFSGVMVLKIFKDNVVNQKISPTYDLTYFYQFSANFNATFDMSTADVKPIEGGIAHSLRGTIKNYNNQHSISAPLVSNGVAFHTLYTLDFIKNFMSYSLQQNKNWLNLKVDLTTFKTRIFKFRLIDL